MQPGTTRLIKELEDNPEGETAQSLDRCLSNLENSFLEILTSGKYKTPEEARKAMVLKLVDASTTIVMHEQIISVSSKRRLDAED